MLGWMGIQGREESVPPRSTGWLPKACVAMWEKRPAEADVHKVRGMLKLGADDTGQC